MVEPSEDVGQENIGSFNRTDPDADQTATKLTDSKMLKEAILNEHYLNVNKADDRQDKAQNQSDTVDALLQRLQAAINDENTQQAQKVEEMRGMLATKEQSLAQKKSLGVPQSVQDGIKSAVDELRLKIANLEAESQAHQSVYEDTEKKMKAKLERRINEIKKENKIEPFAD